MWKIENVARIRPHVRCATAKQRSTSGDKRQQACLEERHRRSAHALPVGRGNSRPCATGERCNELQRCAARDARRGDPRITILHSRPTGLGTLNELGTVRTASGRQQHRCSDSFQRPGRSREWPLEERARIDRKSCRSDGHQWISSRLTDAKTGISHQSPSGPVAIGSLQPDLARQDCLAP